MSRLTAFRRSAAAAGASGIIALSLAGPAAAGADPGTANSWESRCSSGCNSGGSSPAVPAQFIALDDNAIEYLQLGAGVLAGIALAGAGAAVASRRNHAHTASPA